MKYTTCRHCDKNDIPQNDSIKINGINYCGDCFESNFTDEKDIEDKEIEQEMDPTICSNCEQDFGKIVLNKIAEYPICDECNISIKNRTLPVWVKGFFAIIIILVVFSFIWNWRFYESYSKLNESNIATENGDFEKAAKLMKEASNKVPEVVDLKSLSAYLNGISLLSQDKSTEALKEFNKCLGMLPDDYEINELIIQSKIGASFDNQKYDDFLNANLENLKLDTTLPMSLAGVASAYACLYIENGNDSLKTKSLEYLNNAKSKDSTREDLVGYYNKIEYRIYSRKIITSAQFNELYPNGWTKN